MMLLHLNHGATVIHTHPLYLTKAVGIVTKIHPEQGRVEITTDTQQVADVYLEDCQLWNPYQEEGWF